MLKKIICFVAILVSLNCAPVIHYETVRVHSQYGYVIDNWKNNGIKIIHIDTVNTFHGKDYIVKYKD